MEARHRIDFFVPRYIQPLYVKKVAEIDERLIGDKEGDCVVLAQHSAYPNGIGPVAARFDGQLYTDLKAGIPIRNLGISNPVTVQLEKKDPEFSMGSEGLEDIALTIGKKRYSESSTPMPFVAKTELTRMKLKTKEWRLYNGIIVPMLDVTAWEDKEIHPLNRENIKYATVLLDWRE